MQCCARCKPCRPRSRSFTARSATSRKSVSIGSAPRRAEATKSFSGARAKPAKRETLLRRDAHLGSGGTHVGIDVLFVLDEVLLEHAHALAGGFVERRLVLPGLP